jgi:hypothetical protein
VLTEVKAYSSWHSAPTMLLEEDGRAETDLIQIRDIQGLNPVKAAINGSPLAVIDGESFVGANVLSRNIVLTVRPNPDWVTWSYESLRRLIYSYFMSKSLTRLQFLSDDMPTVQIDGYVEDVGVNQFSVDPEMVVSILCPNPHFTTVEPEIVQGATIHEEGDFETIEYNGNIETGIKCRVDYVSGTSPSEIIIQIGDPAITHFMVETSIDANSYFEMSSVPMNKYVRKIDLTTGVITNLLDKVHIEEGSQWPVLQPGENHFHVVTDVGEQEFTLDYYEKFGGL